MKKNPTLSAANKIAHRLKGQGYSWAEALRLGWKSAKLFSVLRNHYVTFTFAKLNGEITTRTGTLIPDALPASKGSTLRSRSSAKVTFWSVTDNGFRSFLPQHLIEVNSIEPAVLAA